MVVVAAFEHSIVMVLAPEKPCPFGPLVVRGHTVIHAYAASSRPWTTGSAGRLTRICIGARDSAAARQDAAVTIPLGGR